MAEMTTHQESYVAEAVVRTDRAGRYLAQLCEHLKAIGPAQPSRHTHPQHVDGSGQLPLTAREVRRSSTLGTIRFDNGICALIADSDTLRMRLNAVDAETLERMKASFAHRLEQIGRRDDLTVIWTARAHS